MRYEPQGKSLKSGKVYPKGYSSPMIPVGNALNVSTRQLATTGIAKK